VAAVEGTALGLEVEMAALEPLSHKMVEDVPVNCSYQLLLVCQVVDCSLSEDLCTRIQSLELPQCGGLG